MKRSFHWYDFLAINSFGFGLSLASGILTPVLIFSLGAFARVEQLKLG